MLENTYKFLQADLENLTKLIQDNTSSEVPAITKLTDNILTAGGKRLRPILFLLASYGNLEKKEVLGRVPMAAALELLHTATLLHDDVLDEAEYRRGVQTVNAMGNNQLAILGGDFLFARAFAVVAQEKDYPREIIPILVQLLTDLSEGEINQNASLYRIRSFREYYAAIYQKTGSFLSAACRIGAIMAGMTSKEQGKFSDFGKYLGMSFQITDDLLDILGDEEQTGKPCGSDLRAGVITMPFLYAITRKEPEQGELKMLLESGPLSGKDLTRAIDLMKKLGGIEYAQKKAEQYWKKSQFLLPKQIPEEVLTCFEEVLAFLAERKA